MNEGTLFLSAIGFLVLFVIIFLLTREFWCWYWKINSIIALLEENNRLSAALLQAEGIADAKKRAGFVRRATTDEAPTPVVGSVETASSVYERSETSAPTEPSFPVPDALQASYEEWASTGDPKDAKRFLDALRAHKAALPSGFGAADAVAAAFPGADAAPGFIDFSTELEFEAGS